MKHDEAKATHVRFDKGMIIVSLSDGREIRAPLTWFPLLLAAKESQLKKWRLFDKGAGIHWDDPYEDVLVSSLLRP